MWPYSFAGSGYSRTGCWRLPLASGTNEDRVLTQMSGLRASATNTMQGELLTSHTDPIRLLQLPHAVHCVVGPWALCSSVQETQVLQWPQEFIFQDGCVAVRKSRQAVPEYHKGPLDLEAAVRLKCLLFLSPWRFTYFRLLGPRSKPRGSIYVFSWALCLHLHGICPYCTAQHSHTRICALSTLALCVYHAILRTDPDPFPRVSQSPRPSPFFCSHIFVASLCFQINFSTTRALVFSSGFHHSTVFDCSVSKLSFIIIIVYVHSRNCRRPLSWLH